MGGKTRGFLFGKITQKKFIRKGIRDAAVRRMAETIVEKATTDSQMQL